MPGSHVRVPMPLTRLNPWFPGQVGGVEGTDEETGLRVHPTGTVFYVDSNYPGADDGRDGTDPTAPLLTVEAALAKCQDHRGDMIVVGANDAWQYGGGAADYTTEIAESVTVDVQGVTIRGLAPSGALGVEWEPAAAGETCITVHALDVLIEGFCFMAPSGGNAIYAEWDGSDLFGENLTVRHCFFGEDVDTAIQLEYAWNSEIYDCIFQYCDEYGIYVDPAGSGAAYNRIHDNIFHNCAKAIAGRGLEDSQIWHNFFFNTDAQGGAAATDVFIDLTNVGASRNIVADNYFSCLLPVPANGDYDDTCTAGTTDAWINNHCMDGPTVDNPS